MNFEYLLGALLILIRLRRPHTR